jgi:hypothetical protein
MALLAIKGKHSVIKKPSVMLGFFFLQIGYIVRAEVRNDARLGG